MVMSHEPEVCSAIVTVTESPAATASDTVRDDSGSISVHASYVTLPPETVACVPAWIRSVPVTPPMPTHVASAPVVVAPTWGTIHVPLTEVYVPPFATYPDQLLDVSETRAGVVELVSGCVCAGAVPDPGVTLCALGCASAWIFHAPLSRTRV